jgi:hypothetical protein
MFSSACLPSSSSEFSTSTDILDWESESVSSSISTTLGRCFFVRSTSGSDIVELVLSMSSPFGMCFDFFCCTVLRAALAFRLTFLRVELAFDARDLKDFELIVDWLSPFFSSWWTVDKYKSFICNSCISLWCCTVSFHTTGHVATCGFRYPVAELFFTILWYCLGGQVEHGLRVTGV